MQQHCYLQVFGSRVVVADAHAAEGRSQRATADYTAVVSLKVGWEEEGKEAQKLKFMA
jgi:hypothetical protein